MRPDCSGAVAEEPFKYHDHGMPGYFLGQCGKCGAESVRCGHCGLLQAVHLDSRATGSAHDRRGVMNCSGCAMRWTLFYERNKLVGIQKIEFTEDLD
jgi:hypothetical protein